MTFFFLLLYFFVISYHVVSRLFYFSLLPFFPPLKSFPTLMALSSLHILFFYNHHASYFYSKGKKTENVHKERLKLSRKGTKHILSGQALNRMEDFSVKRYRIRIKPHLTRFTLSQFTVCSLETITRQPLP